MEHLVSTTWLSSRFNDANVRVIDCQFQLGSPDAGRTAYENEHIPNALHVDLEKDLSGEQKEHGGRHPLPDLEELATKLSAAGIDESTTVVAYDAQGGAMASRLWWLLTFMGHKHVYVLDGGWQAWKKEGNSTSTEIPVVERKIFSLHVQPQMTAQREDIQSSSDDRFKLIDSRDKNRFLGIEEPVDKVAGHIPGAIQHFWKDGLTETGKWKSEKEQKERFNKLDQHEEVIVYCGSGVTACANVLTLTSLGYENVKLYVGSWSDWCSYEDAPIETGETRRT